jgi:hypothetical protein
VTTIAVSQVVVTWNGHALERGEWIVASPDELLEVKVAPRADSRFRTADAIRCYIDGQRLTPSALAFDSAAYQIPTQPWFDFSRRLEVRFVDATTGTEQVALSEPLRIVSRRSIQLSNWVIGVTALLLVAISWRVWDLKVTSSLSQAAGAFTTLSALVAALFGADWWKDGTKSWLRRVFSQPKHLGVVVLCCGAALLFGILIVHSCVRVVHNATNHAIKLTWSEEGEEELNPGAAEAVWSLGLEHEFVPTFIRPMLQSVSPDLYCDAADNEHCKSFRRRLEGLASLQALFGLAPVVSIGCTRAPWVGLPNGEKRTVDPLGGDCSLDVEPHTVNLGAGAHGSFSYRAQESVAEIVRRPQPGDDAPPRLWVTVHAAGTTIESAKGSMPEKVRVSVTATDHRSFREAFTFVPLAESQTATSAEFPVPSLRRAYATRFVLAPEHGAAYGTLTCYPRDQDVDVWVIPAVTGSVLRAQLADQTGRTHSSWSADAIQVGEGGSPVFGLCLPKAVPTSPELTVVVRELDRLLEPTNFVFPSELARKPKIRVVGQENGKAHEVGKLECDATKATGSATIVMGESEATARQISLFEYETSGSQPDCLKVQREITPFSIWTPAREPVGHTQMFQCLWRENTVCFPASLVGPRSSERWAYQVSKRELFSSVTPSCMLNSSYELIKSCPPNRDRDAETFWGKAIWQTIRRDLKPVGCTLQKAKVCL